MSSIDGKYQKAKIIDEKSQVSDGFENLHANLGTDQDLRNHSHFVNKKRLSQEGGKEELSSLYRTDWLAGKIVDIVPEDMTREWRVFDGDITPETIEILKNEEDRLGLNSAFEHADKWGRLYGAGFIVMCVDDGQTPDKPINLDAIKPGGLKHMKVIDRHRIYHRETTPITTNPMDANYGYPEFYQFVSDPLIIHHSRLIRFDGNKVSFDDFREQNYFHDSILDRLYEALTNMATASNGAASMVYESTVDIVKVKGLIRYLQTAEGEAILRKRFTMANFLKSFNNTMILDSEEDFGQKTNNFAGIPALLDSFGRFLAAATDIPATRLLGNSSSGLNATGEGDLKNYYDMVSSKQMSVYKPLLDYIDQIMVRSLGLNPEEDYTYSFKSLFQMTPKEQSETDLNNANRDQMYYNMGVVDEAQIAKDLKEKKTFSNITDEDIAELEEFLEEKEEMTFANIDPNTQTNEFGNEQKAQGGEEEKGGSGKNAEEPGNQVS